MQKCQFRTLCCRGIRKYVVAWPSSVNTTTGRPKYAVDARISQSGAVSLFTCHSALLSYVAAMVILRLQVSSRAPESSRYTLPLSTLRLGGSNSNRNEVFVEGDFRCTVYYRYHSRLGCTMLLNGITVQSVVRWRFCWCCKLRLV